ncbi:MAG: ABC transporter ATP-binding protein [Pseudomonadota bacterium]
MSALNLQNLTVMRDACPVVDSVSLDIGAGECVGLIGPNGAGKTTLMRAALGILPHTGASSLAAMAPKARARACAWLPQAREIAWPVDVETVVRLGRLPHADRPEITQAAVTNALLQMGLQDFAKRTATQLSGGEQARVLIARALAQDAPLLMADEPIAGLDPASQIATMRLFSLLASEGKAVWTAIHDLGLAVRYCTRLIVMHNGAKVADGPPRDVLNPALLAEVFGITAHYKTTDHGPIFQVLDVLE